MLTWVLHRITGVLLFCFLFAHILDTAMVRVAPSVYDGVVAVYHHPIIKLMEIGLVVSLLFHAFNGLRIILVDFWSKGAARVRQLTAVSMLLFVVTSIGATVAMGKQLIDDLGDDDTVATTGAEG